jgi:molecular chaperone GrpE (heat shock protein)
MNDIEKAVDATVVETPVANPAVDAANAQKANFTAQLEQVKKAMLQHQQEFENLKTRGTKLEGALESLDILIKSLSK